MYFIHVAQAYSSYSRCWQVAISLFAKSAKFHVSQIASHLCSGLPLGQAIVRTLQKHGHAVIHGAHSIFLLFISPSLHSTPLCFAVLDPAHLDSADDFTYDVSDNGSENDFPNVGQSGRSYDAVFGPDVNIEYAGFVLLLKSSAPLFLPYILNFQVYMITHVISYQQSLFDLLYHHLRVFGSLTPCSGRGGWHALLQPQKK